VAIFGPVLHEIYGASELGGVCIMGPEHMLQKPLSCGKPAPGIDVVLLDDKKQKITKPNSTGEIFAKGSNIDGYHKLPDKTKDAMFGDYFSVGDVGHFDEDGFLYITSRKTDMIVSGGVNIYPAQVEEVLHQHPDVEDVAVFGMTDDEYGERVYAALKLKPKAQGKMTAKQLLAWCDGKVGRFQLPKEKDISFHSEDFPRSEAGKLRKSTLKEEILKKQGLKSKL
jgi:long-chain acyl-CoA synthetase